MSRLFARVFATYWAAMMLTVLSAAMLPRPDETDSGFVVALGSRIAAALAISVCAALVATHYITRPIRRLREVAADISNGQLSARTLTRDAGGGGKSRDELYQLLRDFDAMAEKLERFVVSQQQVVRDASHELRTPLARIAVAVDLMRQSASADEDLVRRLDVDVARLRKIIDRFLLVLKLDAQAQPVVHEWFALEDVVWQVADELGTEVACKESTLSVSRIPPCTLRGDFELLRGALGNILRNAIMHSQNGAEISVSCALVRDTAAVEIVVQDDGPGIPEHDIANVTRPFFRVDRARTNNVDGFGLGLSIAQRAVLLHGGALEVRNRSQVTGLRVTIRLPIDRSALSKVDAR